MTNTKAPEYLTLRQYAEALGLSTRTVQRMLSAGEIVSDVKLPGPTGAHLFLASRVEAGRQGSAA